MMKFWNIAVFCIILSLVGGSMTNWLQVNVGITDYIKIGSPEDIKSSISAIQSNTSEIISNQVTVGSGNPLQDALGWFYNMIVKALTAIFDPIIPYIFFPSLMLKLLIPGLPDFITIAFSVIVLAIEVAGVVQLVTGRSMREVD